MIIGIMGPPGSGKGTQSERMIREFGFIHLSSGDLLREEIRLGSSIGLAAADLIRQGHLVPDGLINQMMEASIRQAINEDHRLLLDGYPRTVDQLRFLIGRLQHLGRDFDVVFCLDLDEESIVRRLTGRRICGKCGSVFHIDFMPPLLQNVCDRCGDPLVSRPDDAEQAVRERLLVYRRQTRPVLEALGQAPCLRRIDASGDSDAVYRQIASTLQSLTRGSASQG